jgi:hypothetical protein
MSTKTQFFSAIVVFFMLALAPSADALAAQGRGRGQGGKPGKVDKAEKKADKAENKAEKKDDKAGAIGVDRDGHVRVIREYGRGGSLPPGLAKRRSLPPGLRNQLRERGALPPGLQKHLIPVPAPLLVRLPPVPPYYRRYFAGDDLLVVDTRTNRLVALIRDVWR